MWTQGRQELDQLTTKRHLLRQLVGGNLRCVKAIFSYTFFMYTFVYCARYYSSVKVA